MCASFFSKDGRPSGVRALYQSARPSPSSAPATSAAAAAGVGAADDADDALDAGDYDRLVALGATLRRRRRRRAALSPADADRLEIETRRPASEASRRQWLAGGQGVLDDVAATVGTDNRRHLLSRSCDAALHRSQPVSFLFLFNFIVNVNRRKS